MSPLELVFRAWVASKVASWRVPPSKFGFRGLCRLQLLFRRVLPKLVLTARIASQVCFHGVYRLLSLFPWRASLPQVWFSGHVSPSKFRFHGMCRRTILFSWRISPSKFVLWRLLPHKVVFMACVASQVCFHGVCRLTSLFS